MASKCPYGFKHVFYRRCVDDIFALFSSPDHADKIKECLSSKHPNINFSIEEDKDSSLQFLNVNTFCENEKFTTNVYRKRPSVVFLPTSKVLYLEHVKLV